MPRKPTGRPVGRPPGTGHLDNPERITVALPGAMVARLEAYSHGRKLAACVRELLEHALTCPYERQTRPEASTPLLTPRKRKCQAASAD
jgi:hypothetical protein